MKILITLVCILFYTSSTFSQKKVEIKHDYDAVNDAHIRVYNYNDFPVYIVLDFIQIENTSINEDLPIIKRIEPGISEILTLMAESGVPDLEYVFKWYKAHPSPKLDSDFPYLMPVKKNNETTIFHIGYTPGFMGSDVSGKWYSLGFTMEDSKMIYASRKGIVVKVVSNIDNTDLSTDSYSNVNNLIQVLHQDGTIAEYTNFAMNGIRKELGDVVYPGEALGEINTFIKAKPFVGLTVFHANIRSKSYKTTIPKFNTSEGVIKVLAPGSYICNHPEKIRGREMTRKEKKNHLK